MLVQALQHYTSKRYLVLHDDGSTSDHPKKEKASIWFSHEGVEQAHMALGSFAGCWKIVEIDRPVYPSQGIV